MARKTELKVIDNDTSEPAKQIGGKALELLNKKIDEALFEGFSTADNNIWRHLNI
jgi:hypothetical protein